MHQAMALIVLTAATLHACRALRRARWTPSYITGTKRMDAA
jgi:hypothetical protein